MDQSLKENEYVSNLIHDYVELDNYTKEEGQDHGIKFASMLCDKLDGILKETKMIDRCHEISIRLPV